MKRFVCALVMLAITITSAALINNKIIKAADEMIEIIETERGKEFTQKYWQDKKQVFETALPQSRVDRIDSCIAENDAVSAITELKSIKESLKLNISNVF